MQDFSILVLLFKPVFLCGAKNYFGIIDVAVLAVFISFVTGAEGGEIEDAALSSQGKMQIKAGQSKMKNKKHGYVVTDVFLFLQ